MKRWFAFVLALVVAFSATPATAATPADTLVMAWQFDDIITLDPAEIFEFSGAEYAGNTYDRLIGYEVDDVSKIYGVAAESWTVSPDGKTYTFKIRKGITFASGNPLTAEDVAFSLQRTVILDKSPAFILGQFGFTAENVRDRIRAVDANTVTIETDQAYAPTFVLYCLTATVGSVVDKKEVMAHEKDGDLGHAWLRTNYAGSGPFKLNQWKASELLILDANQTYWDGAPTLKRVIIRHIAEQATQRLLVEKGDIDIARNLGPDQIKGLCFSIQEYARSCDRPPLFISIDQEGGRVARLKEPFTQFPGNPKMKGPEDAIHFARVTAAELTEIGVNMNLAPVLDVAPQGINSVQESRVFGHDPSWVSELGTVVIIHLQANNIMAVAKHFPGHGRTSQDSHLELPKINLTPEELRQSDIQPFEEAVKSGIKGIMSAHIQVKEKKLPDG